MLTARVTLPPGCDVAGVRERLESAVSGVVREIPDARFEVYFSEDRFGRRVRGQGFAESAWAPLDNNAMCESEEPLGDSPHEI